MKKNVFIAIAILVVVIGAVVVLSRPASPRPAGNSPTPAAAAPVGPVHEITMTAKRFEFTPPAITVKQGEHVRLKITSQDTTHGFMLPDYNINMQLEPQKETAIEFTADKKGTFTFACSVFCGSGHRSMKGTLTVE